MQMKLVRVLHRKRLKIPGFGQTGGLCVVLYKFVGCVCLLVVCLFGLMFVMIDVCLL
ncbi:hypothetical protein HanIR_Chr05g0210881 [Helianthus annuus]|nr:hypothetical protein HanIR_Chr05g0210881 [Helianthus annuus]